MGLFPRVDGSDAEDALSIKTQAVIFATETQGSQLSRGVPPGWLGHLFNYLP